MKFLTVFPDASLEHSTPSTRTSVWTVCFARISFGYGKAHGTVPPGDGGSVTGNGFKLRDGDQRCRQ